MGYQVPSVNQCYDFTCVIGQLQAWCCSHAPLVQSVYDECKGTSLSEQVAYLFGVVRDVVKAQQCVDENFKTLYDFVKDFFENLDLQEEVNEWLEINLKPYFDEYITKHFPDFDLIQNYALNNPNIYVEIENLNQYSGFSDTSLINWTVENTYNKFDSFLGVHDNYILEKTTLGYANNSDNDGEDSSLPILCYSYKPQMGSGLVSQRKKVILTGAIHGNEKFGAFLMLKLLSQGIEMQKQKLVNNIMGHLEIDFIPIINPYGYNQAVGTNITQQLANTGRYNARGVDLNRNFPYGYQFDNGNEPKGRSPLSEQESKAMDNYFKTIDWNNVILFLDLHQSWQSLDEPIPELLTLQIFSNDERIRGVFTDVWNDSNKLANNMNILLQKQSDNEGASVGESEGWMIFDACHYKKNYFNIGLVEGGKGIYSNNEWNFYAEQLLSLFLTYTITSIDRLKNLCYYDNNSFIDAFHYAISYYCNNLLPLNWMDYENVIYDTTIASVAYNGNRIFLKLDKALTVNRNTDDLNIIINSDVYQCNVYSLDNNKENIIGNTGWGGSKKITNLTSNTLLIGFRKINNSTININRLFKEFFPIVYTTPKQSS